jgi:hypothetical protein
MAALVTKTYLFPLILRRGQPVMTFVVREGKNYWLGTYHNFKSRGAPALPSDYHGVSRVRISRPFYEAFVAESRENHRRYRV